jgi:hypothetical protein
LADLQQAVHELGFPCSRDSQAWAASLMCGDHEQLSLDLEGNPATVREVLADHLGRLHRDMQDNADAVGSLLAENVFNSLH